MRRWLPGLGTALALVLALAPQPAAADVPGGGRDDKQGGDYVVQPGDTLSQIALDNGIDGGHPQLFDLNDDVLTDADHIYAGQRIAVKASVPRRADGSPGPLVNPSIPDWPADQLAPQPLPDSFPDAIAGAPWVVSLGDSFTVPHPQ